MRILSRKKISENDKQSFYFTGPINTSHGVGILCKHIRSLWLICLTRDNIKKRKIQFPNICYMCKKEAETPRHLLLHCEVASELWSMFFCLSGINWTTFPTVKDAYESWCLWKVDKAIMKIWIMIPSCIFWCIWLERNKRCFGGGSTALGILKTRCIANLFSWSNLYPAVNAE